MEKTGQRNDIRVLKEANRYLVLQCILKQAPVSMEDIIQRTGLSRPTVVNIVHRLMEEDILVHDGYLTGSVGRSAALLNLNPVKPVALGIDFEFPAIRMCIANLKGEILFERKMLCDPHSGREQVIAQFYQEVSDFLSACNLPAGALCGAGIGICGTIDSTRGFSLNIERIRNWHNVPIQKDLESLLNVPVYVRNDVHLLGLVEKRCYLPEEMENFIYIAIRTGIGSITYQHGRPMRGTRGNAVFIGHTIVDPSGPRCCCGSRGCLETYAGQQAIVNQYLALTRANLTFEEIIHLADSGDLQARTVLEDAGHAFGITVANLVKTLEINDVIIAGPSIHEESPFVRAASAAIAQYAEGLDLEARLYMSTMTESQFPLGGCFLVFDHLFAKPKLSLFPE